MYNELQHIPLKLSNCFDMQFEFGHKRTVVVTREWNNALPYNRFFVVVAAPKSNGGYLRNALSTESDNQLVLKERHIYFMPRDVPIEGCFREGIVFFAFHFTAELYRGYDIFQSSKKLNKQRDEKGYTNRLETILSNADNLTRGLMIKGTVMELIGEFLPLSSDELIQKTASIQKYENLMAYCSTHCGASLRIHTLAKQMGMSESHLSRIFANDTGFSLKSYITRILVKRASDMLLTSSMKIKEIACQLDFSDEYYFSRFFKKHTGYSPSEFKKFSGIS